MAYNETNRGYLELTASGTETWIDFLKRFDAAVDSNKLRVSSILFADAQYVFHLTNINGSAYTFMYQTGSSSELMTSMMYMSPSTGMHATYSQKSSGFTVTNRSSTRLNAGYTMRLYY